MAISPTGPLLPTSISAGADWATPNNALIEDGSTAVDANVGPGGGGVNPTYLIGSGFGFNLPSTAVIDGIKLEAKVSSGFSGDGNLYVGTNTKVSGAVPNYGQSWPNALTWLTWGSATDLWGRTDWTAADINSSQFQAGLYGYPTHATDTTSIDAMRITVYWHVANQEVPKRYLYKVFNSIGTYLGNLPNVISEFGFTQDINTAGAQISIECGVSPDTSRQPTDVLTDEAGNVLTDESSATLTTEGVIPIVAPGASGTNALIKNGNLIQVFEYSYYWPNGKCMFLGQMERWEANFGGDGGSDTIKVMAYSDGQDLDNYMVRGYPYTYTGDVTQTSQNANAVISQAPAGIANWNRYGQTWKVGAGVTNLGAISLLLFGTANVTVSVYDSTSPTANLLGTLTQYVSVGGATEIQFAFPTSIVTVPLSTLFFTVQVDDAQSIYIYYQNTDVYANGQMQNSNFGGSGGGAYAGMTADLYFKTFSGSGSTQPTFTTLDPTTGMLKAFLNDYAARGGLITYTSSSIVATGLSLTYSMNTNTIYEGIKSVLTLCPDGYYYYVDLGTDVLYCKPSSTTADITLTKGRHINGLRFVATIENLKNEVYFTGGATSGVNLYKLYQDGPSVSLYGPKLERKTDNRVTIPNTANAIGNSAIAELKDESYQTTVAVLNRTMDISLLKPGLIIGFNGFGMFADNVLAQVVSVNYSPEVAILTLGLLPKRLTPEFDKITRGLIAEQTIANPSAPS